MRLPKNLIEGLDDIKSHGDIKKISDLADVPYVVIYRALKNGTCSEKVAEVIIKYYAAKKKRINNILKQFN